MKLPAFLLRAPWKKWGIVAAVGLAVASAVFGYGYITGSSIAKEKMQRKLDAALLAQMEEMAESNRQQMESLAKSMRAEHEAGKKIDRIAIPDTDSCTDVEWMRAYNSAIRAAQGESGTDEAAPPPG